MDATVRRLSEIDQDMPVELLARRRVFGEKMLCAYVELAKGCHVATHHHENEQIAFVISGKVLWRLGDEGASGHREIVVEGGTVIHLPSNFPHGVVAIEDTVILDVLSPPGEMGVDRQGSKNK